MSEIDREGEWLASLEERKKAIFLAALGHSITIVGRNSYTVQEEGLDNPAQLRRINEIQHRVLACLLEVITGEENISFQRSIAAYVLQQADTELKDLLSSAWHTAKERVS